MKFLFGKSEELIYKFENLLREHGLSINSNSDLERVSLCIIEANEKFQKKIPHDNLQDIRKNTLTLVHRKRYEKELYDYTEYFSRTSGLPPDNLVLLSKNMRLDLSNADKVNDLEATGCFGRMMYHLKRL